MSIFDKRINNCAKLDWRILMNGSIALYHSKAILKHDMERLQAIGYQLNILDFSMIKTEEEFHRIVKEKLEFPDYYGENLDAFSDCLLSDLIIPEGGGVAIIFINFDEYYENSRDFAHELLECLDLNARRRILFGERFITLVQSNNREIVIKNVGSHAIMWNMKESVSKTEL